MQVSNMQSDDSNRKESSPMQGLNLPCPRSLGWMGGTNQAQTYLGQSLHLYSSWCSSLATITSNHCISGVWSFMKHYWYLNYLNCCIFWSFFVSIFREKVKSREETLAANAAAKSLSLFEYAWKHFKWTTFSNKVLSSALTITVSLSLSPL